MWCWVIAAMYLVCCSIKLLLMEISYCCCVTLTLVKNSVAFVRQRKLIQLFAGPRNIICSIRITLTRASDQFRSFTFTKVLPCLPYLKTRQTFNEVMERPIFSTIYESNSEIKSVLNFLSHPSKPSDRPFNVTERNRSCEVFRGFIWFSLLHNIVCLYVCLETSQNILKVSISRDTLKPVYMPLQERSLTVSFRAF